MTTQEKIVKNMITELKNRYKNNKVKYKKELNKIQRFIKSSDYFKGQRYKLYRIVINAKKD